MQPKHSIFYNALLLTGVNLLLRAVSMLFQIYLSGLIGAAGIGLLQLILSVGSFAMTLGLSGVRVGAMYLCAEEYGHRRFAGIKSAVFHCLFYGLIISTVVAVGFYCLSDYAAVHWVKDVRAAQSLRILALFLPANCACSILAGYFTACNQIRRLVVVEVVDRLVSVLITTLLILFWARQDVARSCSAIILGSSLSCVGCTVVLWALFLHDCKSYGAIPKNLNMAKRMLRLCLPLAAGEYLRSGLTTLEQFLIPWGLARSGHSQLSSMASYGTICGMVFPIMMFPAAILYSLSDLLVPELARCRAESNEKRIHHLTEKCLRMGLIFAGLISGIMFALSDLLGLLIYNSSDCGMYLRLFSPMILELYMDALVDGMHKGLGQQVANVRYNTITSFLDVVFLYLLLPRFGIGGYVFTFVITHLINFWLSFRRLIFITNYAPPMSFVFKTLLCTIAAVASCFCFPVYESILLTLILKGIAFISVFSLLLYLTDAMTDADRFWLRHALSVADAQKKSF